MTPPTLVEVAGLVKDHQALRPLRMRALAVSPGDVVAISGIDALGAEAFVHLVTGAMLPDAGVVRLFGQDTRAIPDGDSWLQLLEGLGMLSSRAVLIEMFSAMQNIAMPFTLNVDPVDPHVVPQASALAREAGLGDEWLDVPVSNLAPDVRMRIHLARALALSPRLLIAEHPTAELARGTVAGFAADLGRVARDRGLGLIALTADEEFARALGGTRLKLEPATGEWRKGSGGFWEVLKGAGGFS